MSVTRSHRSSVMIALITYILSLSWVQTARAEEADPLPGKWTLEIKMGGAPMLADLAVEKDATGALKADIKTQFGPAKIEDITTDDKGMRVLKYSMEGGGRTTDVTLKLRATKDDLSGFVLIGESSMGLPVKGARVGSETELAMRLAAEAAREAKLGKPILPIADAGAFVGEWSLTVESEVNGTQVVDFIVQDDGGMATAELKMPPPIGDQKINNITKSATGLNFHYGMSFGSQEFKIVMALELKDEKITGSISDEGGLFDIPVSGVRKGSGDATDAAVTGRAPRRQRPGATTQTFTLTGARIDVVYGSPSINAAGANRVPFAQAEGFIWAMGKDSATKMRTNADLKFGDTTIPTGRYGLWAKRTAEGWSLIVNSKPDVWSTQHDPQADLAEVPMTAAKLDAPVENLTIEFLDNPNSPGEGLLRLTWGDDELKAPFKIVK